MSNKAIEAYLKRSKLECDREIEAIDAEISTHQSSIEELLKNRESLDVKYAVLASLEKELYIIDDMPQKSISAREISVDSLVSIGIIKMREMLPEGVKSPRFKSAKAEMEFLVRAICNKSGFKYINESLEKAILRRKNQTDDYYSDMDDEDLEEEQC